MSAPFQLDRRPGDGTHESIVTVAGEIDHATGPAFEAMVTSAMSDGGHVRIDLDAVTFMDSTGITAMLRSFRQAPPPARPHISAASEPVRWVITVAGLAAHFGIEPLAGRPRLALGESPTRSGSNLVGRSMTG